MKTTDFLKEGIGEDASNMHKDHEVQMARQECYGAARDAIALHKLLKNISELQGLEGWVSEKITLAADYLKTVHDYLEYELMNDQAAMPSFNMESADRALDTALGEGIDKDDPIAKEYAALMKKSIGDLRSMIKLQKKIVDVSGYTSKDQAASDILRSKYGNKKVAAAMGLNEGEEDRMPNGKPAKKKTPVVVQTNKPIGFRIADIGPGGKEYNVKTDKEWDKQKGVAEGSLSEFAPTTPGSDDGSSGDVIKSVTVGPFRHDLVDTGFGFQVRIYYRDGTLYYSDLTQRSVEKGLDSLASNVAYTKKQLRIKDESVAEGSDGFSIEDMVMSHYHNGNEVWEIARHLNMSEDEVQDIIDSHGQSGVAEDSDEPPADLSKIKTDKLRELYSLHRHYGQTDPRSKASAKRAAAELTRRGEHVPMDEQSVAEGEYNPDTFVRKKATYKGYGLTQDGPYQWSVSASARKFPTLAAAKRHIDKNLILPEGFPHDVDHMPGPVIRNADMVSDNVKTKDKAEWDRAVNSINSKVFDDDSEFVGGSKGTKVTGNGTMWAMWNNEKQVGWFNAKGRPLKTGPVKEAEGALDEVKAKEIMPNGDGAGDDPRIKLQRINKKIKEYNALIAQHSDGMTARVADMIAKRDRLVKQKEKLEKSGLKLGEVKAKEIMPNGDGAGDDPRIKLRRIKNKIKEYEDLIKQHSDGITARVANIIAKRDRLVNQKEKLEKMGVKEDASAGASSAGAVATVVAPLMKKPIKRKMR